MSRFKLRLGDVFAVPIDESRVGVGQVVGMFGKNAYYLAIFDATAHDPDSIQVDRAISSRVMFLALSFDAKLANGDWVKVGNHPVKEGMPLPAFKEALGRPDRVYVVDYSGERRRPARKDEAEVLPNRKVVALVRLEKALRAKFGLEPWTEAYTDLAPDEATTSERLFKASGVRSTQDHPGH